MANTICLVGTEITFAVQTTLLPAYTSASNTIEVSEDNTSSFASTDYMEFEPSCLRDPGTFEMGIFFDPNLNPSDVIGQPKELITIDWPVVDTVTNTVGAKWSFQGYVSSLSMTGEIEGRATATMGIRAGGPITVLPEAVS